MQVMIFDDTGMPDRFIETDSNGVQSMRRLDDGWCEALNRNTFLCDQYANRPLICREFELGGEDCLSTRVDVSAPWMGDDPTD
jgi:Fe-S-cluster containining protein